jgi:hypothetical protein
VTLIGWSCVIERAHVVELEHGVPHAVSLNPAAGVALSVTGVPSTNVAAQPVALGDPLEIRQLIPAGELVTIPFPAPPEMASVR